MANPTLLKVVQDILSNLGDDEVNSIADTVRSTQVATLVKQIHDELIVEYDIARKRSLTQLEGLADSTKPTYMRIPSTITALELVKYDTRTVVTDDVVLRDITFLEPSSFVSLVSKRAKSDTNITNITDSGGVILSVFNDRQPSFWTSIDDEHIIFDSHDAAIDATMQSSNSAIFGEIDGELVVADSTVIDLPAKILKLFINEAEANCFSMFDEVNIKVEQRARRSRLAVTTDKGITGNNHAITYIAYGRR